MWRNTSDEWGGVSRILHWGMALMILGMLGVGLVMTTMAPSPEQGKLYSLHKATGVTVLILAMLRLGWRLSSPIPLLPKSLPEWQKSASRSVVLLLYLLMILIPLSGAVLSLFSGHEISYFGLFTIPAFTSGPTPLASFGAQAHKFMAYGLIGVVSLHGGAALYHHFYLKDGVLRRMITGKLGAILKK